jgi:transposase
MRGSDERIGALFSYVDLEDRVPRDHPLRAIRGIVNAVLARLSADFAGLYSTIGRPSIPPEKLLRALLLQALYSVRSERQLMEQLDYNLLFRWFVGLGIDDAVWDATVFCKNRDRLLKGDVAQRLLEEVVDHARFRGLLSDDHFSVDGTLIEAWASAKSFRPKDDGKDEGADGGAPQAKGRNAERDFHGEKRSNETHASTTDPDARVMRKGRGKEAKLCYAGHVVMENRGGLAVAATVTQATGTAERDAARAMVAAMKGRHRITLGADKAYDTQDFVDVMRALRVTPHVAQNTARRRSRIDGRTTRHAGYAVSQRIRKRIEEIFGWVKTTGGLRKTRHRGTDRVGWMFTLTVAAYNVARIPKLCQAAG